jgi:hypothetical protein
MRSVTRGIVVDGHVHENDATGDGAPLFPCESAGVTFQ